MKINGTNEIIKLLLEAKVGEGEIRNSNSPENLEKIAQKVEDVILRKDEFIQSDKMNIVKTEVQFTKSLNESPEAYLNRISSEVTKQRENMDVDTDNALGLNDSNRIRVETAIRSGLLKDFIGHNADTKQEAFVDKGKIWLYRLVAIFSIVLIIYFLII